MSLAARSKTNGGSNGAKARTTEFAPYPVNPRDGNGKTDPALEGAQEVELLTVRLWPVVKVTAFFATATAAVWLTALGVAWVAATSMGLTHSFQSFVRDIGFEGFKLDARPVFFSTTAGRPKLLNGIGNTRQHATSGGRWSDAARSPQ